MRRTLLLLFLLFATATPASADVRLAKVFSDNMVVQQQAPIRVFGFAEAQETVTVELNGQSAKATADQHGRWRVELPAMEADGKSHTLTVRGKNTVELKNVVLGEVWLAVGQSNMSRGLRYVKDRAQREPMDQADLRLLFVGLDQVPQQDEPATIKGWAAATHDAMTKLFVHPELGPYEFSEVTYYFGKELHAGLRVPVGMISAAYPGSTVAQWTPADKPAERFDFAAGKPDKGPGGMYQAMLHGVAPLAIRGVIYYQGENDGANQRYDRDLKKLIEAWRGKFERPQMAFLMAQLGQTTFSGGILRVTESQQWAAANVPHTAVAASNDLIDNGRADAAKLRDDKVTGWPTVGGGDPHPPNKHLMAGRLARLALAQVYQKSDAEARSPTVVKHESQGDKLRVKFAHSGKGLKTDDGQAPNWFELAGGDKKFVKATAKIVDGDVVELQADGINEPQHVRFAWNTLARHNLYNSEGVSALAFRSDAPATDDSEKKSDAAKKPEQVRADGQKNKPGLSMPTSRTDRQIEGWTIRIDDRLLDKSQEELTTRSLKFLEAKLVDIKAVVPADALKELQKVKIVMDLNCGGLNSMQYHPDAGWLKSNGYTVDLEKCVHIPIAAQLATRRNINEQPWVVLHELAHAFHDQVLSFNNPRVIDVYQAYKKSGRGDATLLYSGKRVKHYALTNQMEFFAEMTESFFGCNDFYPFTRAELEESEKETFALLTKVWNDKYPSDAKRDNRAEAKADDKAESKPEKKDATPPSTTRAAGIAKPVKVFILAGQSNMQGKGSLVHLEELVKTEPAKFGHLKKDGKWIERDDVSIMFCSLDGRAKDQKGKLSVGYTYPKERLGPELSFGEVVGDAFDEPVVLIKTAWGGQSLDVDFRPPSAGWDREFDLTNRDQWKPGSQGWAYKQIFNELHIVLDNWDQNFPHLAGRKHEIVGLVWFQGWNDLIDAKRVDAYEKNLVHFIRDIRKHLDKPRLPIVIGVMGQGGEEKVDEKMKKMRAAQSAPAEMEEFRGTVAAVPTAQFDDPTVKYDGGYHYHGSARFYYDAGTAFGKAMLKLLERQQQK